MATITDAELAQLEPYRTSYPSDGHDITAYLLRPAGDGPHPAIVVCHGSGGLMHRFPEVAQTFVDLGFVTMVAGRRGYNGNPGRHWTSYVVAPEGSAAWSDQVVEAMWAENDDVLAAADWLVQQPGVDRDRLFVTGYSVGGINTTLALSRTDRFRAGVNFAGSALIWEQGPSIRTMLLEAVRRTRTPLMLIQAANDRSLEPTYNLGLELARGGKPHEARIYAPCGATMEEGHRFFMLGIDAWRDDVARFLRRWL